MDLPLGIADFALIRDEGYYYLDKTPFIPILEDARKGRYACFLRPRRFGKSTLLSMLHHYYDIAGAADFDRLFSGLYVHDHPTREKSSYLVLHLEFTGLSAAGGVDSIRADFLERVRQKLDSFFKKYEPLLPEPARLWREHPSPSAQPAILIAHWFHLLLDCPHKVYLLVDEYDSFATDIIASGDDRLYHDLVESTGFVREFYKVLKEACGRGVISRVLLTGALPVMLYDMASGFNILTYISGDRDLNTLCGLTEEQVADLFDRVVAHSPLPRTRGEVLADLRSYYNGYRFNKRAPQRVYNPEMVFYFLRKLTTEGEYPESLLPPNTHMVYSKLRSLVFPGGEPRPGPMEHLRSLFSTGHMDAYLYEVFPLRDAHSPAYFASYLYYQGLLTIEGSIEDQLRLRVPNAVIQGQHGEALAALLADAAETADKDQVLPTLGAMASRGDIVPFLRLLYRAVLSKLSQRDLIKMDEKSAKLLVVGYASLSPLFLTSSEHEVRGGYADVVLLCNQGYPGARHSFVLELKYVPLSERGPTPQSPRRRRSPEELQRAVAEKMDEAEAQLARYLGDERLRQQAGPGGLLGAALVFQGFEDIHFRAPHLGQPSRAISACLEEEG